MSESFHLKAGDTSPQIEAVLRSNDGNPVDLRDAEILFRLRAPRGGDVLVEELAEVVDEDGLVRYTWDEEDTDEPGRYRAEFVVEYVNGDVESFPNDGYHDVIITS
ncbi:hypothetical protein AArcSl_1289 [Halalkaliarchaeum desulfuricum]|uniref:Uncharacterized protein n=1 Tax=Halalkaliarchaeum desulfuricum TaxID=2055893 RepID=A0A343TIJ8_9EURY|nr:BppU family phage baseplate upper protein [Halalkaliarchaeum desulfuricum]AUX08920.1 hypothetical protein AArcSl_1289 [Halalkaliarchaeum desulfuricum]